MIKCRPELNEFNLRISNAYFISDCSNGPLSHKYRNSASQFKGNEVMVFELSVNYAKFRCLPKLGWNNITETKTYLCESKNISFADYSLDKFKTKIQKMRNRWSDKAGAPPERALRRLDREIEQAAASASHSAKTAFGKKAVVKFFEVGTVESDKHSPSKNRVMLTIRSSPGVPHVFDQPIDNVKHQIYNQLIACSIPPFPELISKFSEILYFEDPSSGVTPGRALFYLNKSNESYRENDLFSLSENIGKALSLSKKTDVTEIEHERYSLGVVDEYYDSCSIDRNTSNAAQYSDEFNQSYE